MTDGISPKAFHESAGVEDWRVIPRPISTAEVMMPVLARLFAVDERDGGSWWVLKQILERRWSDVAGHSVRRALRPLSLVIVIPWQLPMAGGQRTTSQADSVG